ncbi:MAG: NADPH-dependent F420 reductase [Armatimonadetes bacterium]|nr:NADPH-dependent F420 reductase [Armatimonadota bacterium]
MRVAIIGGTGKEGFGLAMRWARAGVDIIIGSRDAQRAQDAAGKANAAVGAPRVTGMLNPAAAAEADIVLISVPFEGHRAMVADLKDAMAGKVLVDITVPVAFGGVPAVVPVPEGSAAEAAQKLLGPRTPVVAAFQTIPAHLLADAEKPLEGDVFICGDDAQAKARVVELVQQIGTRAIDCGPLSQTHTLERMTVLLLYLNRRLKRRSLTYRLVGL